MELTVHNFKCWENKQLSFNSQGITLISGKSGVGKTSIIESIIFVLFGSGRKIIRYGQKHCMVKLRIPINNGFLEVQRTKGPNRLTVRRQCMADQQADEYYEDAAAQAVIDSYYGQQYQSIGYLSQSSINSFVLMGPQEKLSFLENLIFQNTDIRPIKQKVQQLIKERLQQQQQIIGKIDILKARLRDKNADFIDPVDFPIKINDCVVTDPTKQNIIEKNKQVARSNNKKQREAADKKLSSLATMLQEWQTFDQEIKQHVSKKDILLDRFDQLCSNNNFDVSPDSHSPESISSMLEGITTKYDAACAVFGEIDHLLCNIKSRRTCLQLKQKIDQKTSEKNTYMKKERDTLSKQLDRLTSTMIDSDENALQEELETLKEYRDSIRAYCKLKRQLDTLEIEEDSSAEELGTKIAKSEKDIEDLIKIQEKLRVMGKKYQCPGCHMYLTINADTNKLVPNQETSEHSRKEIEEQIARKKKRVSRYKQTLQKCEETEACKNQYNAQMLNISEQYEEFEYSDEMLEDIGDQITDLAQKISQHKENKNMMETIQEKLSDRYVGNQIIKKLCKEIDDLSREFERYPQDLPELEIDIPETKTIEDVESDTRQRLYECTTDKTNLSKTIEAIKDIKHEICELDKKIDRATKTYQTGKKLSSRSILKHQENNEAMRITLNEEREIIDQQIEQISTWKIQNEKYIQYCDEQKELRRFETDESVLCGKLKGIYRLKDLIRDAESLCLTKILASINDSVTSYLDVFFQSYPIKVTLTIRDESDTSGGHSTTTKNQRIGQIHITVDYKDMEADIGILSGGELQRVIIAYNMALSELFNVPLILFDECTSNLDQELTEVIVRGIRHNSFGKNIIMIAHQVVSGIFDQTIMVEE